MRRAIKIIAPVALAAAIVIGTLALSSGGRPRSLPPMPPPLRSTPPSRQASPELASDITAGRSVTAKYVTNLARAKAAGYRIITRMIRTWATTS